MIDLTIPETEVIIQAIEYILDPQIESENTLDNDTERLLLSVLHKLKTN